VFAPRHFVLAPAPHAQPSSDDGHWVTTIGLSLLVLATFAAVVLGARGRSGTLVAAVTDGTREWRRGVGL
jgi:hypothetical protein